MLLDMLCVLVGKSRGNLGVGDHFPGNAVPDPVCRALGGFLQRLHFEVRELRGETSVPSQPQFPPLAPGSRVGRQRRGDGTPSRRSRKSPPGRTRPPPTALAGAVIHAGGAPPGRPGRGAAAGPRQDDLHAAGPGRTAPRWDSNPLGKLGPRLRFSQGLGTARPNLLGGFAGQAAAQPKPSPRPSARVPGTKAECLLWGCEDNGPGILPPAGGGAPWGQKPPPPLLPSGPYS